MAKDLRPFSEKNHIVKHEDNLLFWFALKQCRSYTVSSLLGYKTMQHRGQAAKNMKNPVFLRRWALDAATIQRKILSSEEDAARRALARKMLKGQFEWVVLSLIASLPEEDKLAVFTAYVSSVPEPMRKEILSAMERRDRKLVADYEKATKTGGDRLILLEENL
ncbi:MAG: hypothetical protein LBB14_01870 [Puniceicoccales bacterium]|jgi:hypothetical protein|nr:hypothetical protein [Puniceicoccales bacterium]